MLPRLTQKLIDRGTLSEADAAQALEFILTDHTPDAAIASFLTALAIRGETWQGIAGFARVMRRHAVQITSCRERVIDTAGTGGGPDTFNISTTAAFVIAGAGVAVAKHGNRAMTSRCGSADVLVGLGVKIDITPQMAEQCLNELGIAFLFAPLYHPAMKRVVGIRRQLGHRTIFNLLGPLTNPAGAPYQIIGVYSADLTEKMARALSHLGCQRAWVVHAQDGLDELSAWTHSRISEVSPSGVRNFDFDPCRVLTSTGSFSSRDVRGGTPEENAQKTLEILEGRVRGAARDLVVLNAAAALHVAGKEAMKEAIGKAEHSLDSGAAREKLRALVELSNAG